MAKNYTISTSDFSWSVYFQEKFSYTVIFSFFLFETCHSMIQNDSCTSLWVDKWLDMPIVKVIVITDLTPSLSSTKVSYLMRTEK